MGRLTYRRGLRLESGAGATGNADNSWLDDRTTSQYALVAGSQPQQPGQGSPRTAAKPPAPTLPLSAAGRWVPAPRQAAVDAAIERFWQDQSRSRRSQIMGRVFDPPWLRALGALLGIALAVVFGWVLVAGPELPSFTPKTKTLVPGVNIAEVPQPVGLVAEPPAQAAADSPNEPAAVSGSLSPQLAAVPQHTAARSGGAPARKAGDKRVRNTKSAVDSQREVAAATRSGKPATLRVDSRPWSEVFIDDKAVGSTPQLSISLEPGVHSVRLHNRQLNLLKILTLHVLPGETIERVEQLAP